MRYLYVVTATRSGPMHKHPSTATVVVKDTPDNVRALERRLESQAYENETVTVSITNVTEPVSSTADEAFNEITEQLA